MDKILGVDVTPGDRLVLRLSTGGNVLGTYVKRDSFCIELGPTIDDHLLMKSVVQSKHVIGIQMLHQPEGAVNGG